VEAAARRPLAGLLGSRPPSEASTSVGVVVGQSAAPTPQAPGTSATSPPASAPTTMAPVGIGMRSPVVGLTYAVQRISRTNTFAPVGAGRFSRLAAGRVALVRNAAMRDGGASWSTGNEAPYQDWTTAPSPRAFAVRICSCDGVRQPGCRRPRRPATTRHRHPLASSSAPPAASTRSSPPSAGAGGRLQSGGCSRSTCSLQRGAGLHTV
jgi:hypothetical protein